MGRIRLLAYAVALMVIPVMAAVPAAAAPLKTNLYGLDGLFLFVFSHYKGQHQLVGWINGSPHPSISIFTVQSLPR